MDSTVETDGYRSTLKSSRIVINPMMTDKDTYLLKNTVIIGRRMSGKTTLILHEIYGQIRQSIEQLYVILPNGDHNQEYQNITNQTYTPKDIDAIVATITANPKKQTLVIIDGCDYQSFKLNLRRLILNGRHFGVTLIITEQTSNMTPQIRSCMDNVIVAPDVNPSVIKKLYDQYFGIYPHLNTFSEIMRFLCKHEHTFLFSSNRLDSDKVGWLKVDISRPIQLEEISHEDQPVPTPDIKTQGEDQVRIKDLIAQLTKQIDDLIAIRNRVKQWIV